MTGTSTDGRQHPTTINQRCTEPVPVSGGELYANGVPLSESQFRELWAVLHVELDELPPQPDRTEWELKRGYAAINKFSVVTRTTIRPSPFSETWTGRGTGMPPTIATQPVLNQAINESSKGCGQRQRMT